jgi:hypothetical protein
MRTCLCGFAVVLSLVAAGCTAPESSSPANADKPSNGSWNYPISSAATPLPTPLPDFAQLKERANILLASHKVETDLDLDTAANDLLQIPRESKDYKEAQTLAAKLKDASKVAKAAAADLGPEPRQNNDGSVDLVKDYLRGTLNDYNSAEFVEWSPITKVRRNGKDFWAVRLRLRAKNAFGAYVLKETFYFIQNGKVVDTTVL